MAFVALSPSPAAPIVSSTSRAGDQAVASRSRGRLVASHIVLGVLAVASIFPVYWMFVTAFRAPGDAVAQTPFPLPPSIDSFLYVWRTIPIGSMLANTFGMSTALSIAQLLVAIFAAYGFSTWEFRGKKLLFLLFIGSWLVPFQVTMIPNYVLISQLGLLNTVAGVIVPNLCSAFAVMLMRQHMQAFPRDLIDASHMDGRSSWGTLWTVVLPNLKPALAALGIMLFISAWNEYLWPTLVLQQNQNALIQVGIRSFLGTEGNNWGAVMAASGLACIPIFLIYIFLQRYVVDAFIRSGLK